MKRKKFSAPVSLVIPSFNGKKLLEKNLPSVIKACRNLDEILIVDDGSSDQTVNWLMEKFSLLRTSKHKLTAWQRSSAKKILISLLPLEKNHRFAAAVNIAVKLSKYRYIGLFNNDVSLESKTISNLIRWFADKNVFAVACLEFEGKSKLTQRSGKNSLWFEQGLFQHSRANNFASGQTAWVSGGSGLFDKKKWQALGGFDQKYYPAYWEDIDLSFRAKKYGWKVLFDSESVVFHQHESTHGQVFSRAEALISSWHHADYFTWKNGDIWQKIAYLIWRPYWWLKRRRASQRLE